MWRRAFANVRDRRNNGGGPRTRYVPSDYFKYLCYLFQLVLVLDAARVEQPGRRSLGLLHRSLAAPRPARERYSRPRRALSPQPCAPGRLCSPPCIVIVSLAYSFALSRSLSLPLACTHGPYRSLSRSPSFSLSPTTSPHPLSLSLARLPPPPTSRRCLCRARTSHRVCSSSRQTSPTSSTAPMRLRIDRCAQSPRGPRFVSRCHHRAPSDRRSPINGHQPVHRRTHDTAGWDATEK